VTKITKLSHIITDSGMGMIWCTVYVVIYQEQRTPCPAWCSGYQHHLG